MRRLAVGIALLALAAAEAVVARAYAVRGTTWHFLLHSSIGFGLGLAAAALYAALRGRPTRGLAWAVAGQLVSILPDVLFFALRLPHQYWMDAFVGHLTVHVAPQPLLVGLGVFALGGWAWWLAGAAGRRGAGALFALLALGLLGGAIAVHRPIPVRLAGYSADNSTGSSWAWCGRP